MERNPSSEQEGTGLLVTLQALRTLSPPATLSPFFPVRARLKPRTTSTRAPHSAPKCNFRAPHNCPLLRGEAATFVLPQMLALPRETKDWRRKERSRAVGREPDQVEQEDPHPSLLGARRAFTALPPAQEKPADQGSLGNHPGLSPWTGLKPRLGEEPSPELWGGRKRMAHPPSPQPCPPPHVFRII